MKKWDKNHEKLLTSSIYKHMKRAATHLFKKKAKIGLFQNYRTFTLIQAPSPLSMNFRNWDRLHATRVRTISGCRVILGKLSLTLFSMGGHYAPHYSFSLISPERLELRPSNFPAFSFYLLAIRKI